MNISAKQTAVYAADASVLADPVLYAEAYAAASPRRRAKADSYRFDKDKRLALGAELLLRYGLKEAGLEEYPEFFDYGRQGKPYLKERGIWFSLSHSGDMVLCAVSGCEVGCDVEKIRPIDLKTARRFAPEEYEDIMSKACGSEQLERFYRYWTLKESFMKVTGLGMKLPLNKFRILIEKEISVSQSVDERSYVFWEFSDIPGYKCALCTAGQCGSTELKILDLTAILY